jgi:hypothetical protein
MPVEGRYDASGRLWDGSPAGANRADIVRHVLEKLTAQLFMVCTWPADCAERTDVVGAYRFFILDFSPREQVSLYLQVWSEPGDPVLFEVSSGYGYAPTEAYLTQTMKEALLGRGFEFRGPAKNFQKKVVVTGRSTIRTLAREMLAIAVDVLGYDGKVPLTFRFHQDSRTEQGRLFRGIQPNDFQRLLERWGITAKFTPDDQPVLNCRSTGLRFVVRFHVECSPSFSLFEIATCDAIVKVKAGQAHGFANEINLQLITGRAIAMPPDSVALSLAIVVGGGVAPENLRRQVLGWAEQARKVIGRTRRQ